MGFDTGWKSRLWLFPLMILPPLLTAQSVGSSLPSELNLENLPDTSFSCEGKVVGGYYADIETKCQMFHVCTLGQKGETQDIKFLCLQGTVFDQETRVCERSEEVTCKDAEEYYDLNKELYQTNNKAHREPTENVTDSEGEASVASVLLRLDSSSSSLGFPAAVYTDDNGTGAFADGGRTRRPTRTRSDVPLFGPRRSESRPPPPPPPASEQAFGRFRQTRLFTGPSWPTPTSTRRPRPPATVPLIPSSADLDRPRLVVTNGKPFVPKLSAPDPAPALHQEESFPSLTLPDTNFTCESKVSGGHYADPETNCKMFHICVMGPDGTITDYKLLCGSNTAFEQKSRTCQEVEKVDCASSADNYHVNDHLIVPKTTKEVEYKFNPSKTENLNDYTDYYDYYFDYPEYKETSETSTARSRPSRGSKSKAPQF
ncbi:uncharacterized protein LOC119091679 isoform X2 [Pollicipes pollicipes]|uniref:uncharacterized protein LOC119091679 isoform X2 n=1 Tax=Pollicipes pollicipes TaxID=41117 RepID=UPI00188514B3|nr:uncharacterized protein LOC119091679 isoform X2 [Pollicipes pollicipes]